MFDHDCGCRLQDLVSTVVVKMLQSCLFVSMACQGLLQLACYGFMAGRTSLPYSHEENYPDPKSGWELVPNKPVCATSGQEDVTDTSFLHAFLWFSSPIPQLWPPILES